MVTPLIAASAIPFHSVSCKNICNPESLSVLNEVSDTRVLMQLVVSFSRDVSKIDTPLHHNWVPSHVLRIFLLSSLQLLVSKKSGKRLLRIFGSYFPHILGD